MTDNPHHLQPGFMLMEYRIETVLGSGGFGVTYRATDTHLRAPVAIKEFFPAHCGARGANGSLMPRTSAQTQEFEADLERFLSEAQTLAQFSEEPGIVRVRRFFRQQGTAYIVMNYIGGDSLSARIKKENGLTPPQVQDLVLKLLAGLEKIHRAGFLHRDIKPANILLTEDGQPVLIDFGAARQAIGAHSAPLSVILTPGYAPIEQYSEHDEQGAYTDIYGLAAVAYAALMGRAPPDATRRRRNDPYEPLLPQAESPDEERLFGAIDWGLRPNEDERPQSVPEWRDAILGLIGIPVYEVPPPVQPRSQPPSQSWPNSQPNSQPQSQPRSVDMADATIRAAAAPAGDGLTHRVSRPGSGLAEDGYGDAFGDGTLKMPSGRGASAPDPVEDEAVDDWYEPEPEKSRKGLFIGGGVLAVVAAGLVAFFVISGSDKAVALETRTADLSDEWQRFDLSSAARTGDRFGIQADAPIRVRVDGKTYLVDGTLDLPAALGDIKSDFIEARAVDGTASITLSQEIPDTESE